ncbi:MAG: SCP2 sterol-binding domain-containing protein [Gammaproteobacteria bacterium]
MESVIQKSSVLINRILAMDTETASALQKYSGRTLAVAVTGTRYQFYITIVDDGVAVSDVATLEPDVTVRGTPSEFMAFLRRTSDGGSAAGTIEIAGDVGLAQELQALIRRLEPDWEEYLSGWLGDTPARKLANLAQQSARFVVQARRTVNADISEYLRYETEVLPDRAELDEFNAAVDTLRDDVERLRVRIDRLGFPAKSS